MHWTIAVMVEFGPLIKQERQRQNFTIRELAEKTQIDYTYLSKLENGRVAPPQQPLLDLLLKELGIIPVSITLRGVKKRESHTYLIEDPYD